VGARLEQLVLAKKFTFIDLFDNKLFLASWWL
jgi:hypothetical protein